MRAGWIAIVVAGCSFEPPGGSVDAPGDPTIDGAGPTIDGAPGPDAPPTPDAPPLPPDAMLAACPTSLPPGCSGVLFECDGSLSCYAYCSGPSQSATGAETQCMAWGGHLMSIATVEEQTCTVAILTSIGAGPGDEWIGLYQTGGTSPTTGWGFLDGTPDGGYSAWHTAQPDDYQGTENGEEQCGDLEIGWTWEWNDEVCTDSQAYLCERPR